MEDSIKTIIGLIETVTIKGNLGKKTVRAKIDTGADRKCRFKISC
jgi:hypothetical protein